MATDAPLIVQVAQRSAVERRLRSDPPASVVSGAAVLDVVAADERGRAEPPDAGQVVLSVPSPEALARQSDDVRRVIDGAGDGIQPLVVVVEAAETLRDDELASVLDAAGRTRRNVILRIAGDA